MYLSTRIWTGRGTVEVYPDSAEFLGRATVTAVPASGYTFSHWLLSVGDNVWKETDNPLTISDISLGEYDDLIVGACFVGSGSGDEPGGGGDEPGGGGDEPDEPIKHNVTTAASPSGGGTTTGDGEYDDGATCTLTATPADGWQFDRWVLSTGVTSTNATHSFQVTRDVTATAHFKAGNGALLHGAAGMPLFGASGRLIYSG